ncbi:LrgB family protein [Bacillus sp. BRMEA1]|uniref:LrgB family protein n=1 Tax=Neobacillus endophyticus TaxID=2738405 RepID=UPI0015649F5E|nr:LrgB family protein [Neobacillus endophyticus]NRD80110.1 LrgB family protein [Neobacillus endophyticus]
MTYFTCISFTLFSYYTGFQLYKKYKWDWLNPLYTGSIILILLLLTCHIREETFQQGSMIFNQLLKLAVVSLAVPLYKQWPLIRKNYKKICTGVIGGSILGIFTVVTMAQLFHLNQQILASLITKSVTLPIALMISSDLGGLSSTTVFFVISSGLISLIIGPKLLNQFRIKTKGARGLAMGTSGQMLGANRSRLWGEEEGAMGSVAMITSAIFLTILMPILPFLLKI